MASMDKYYTKAGITSDSLTRKIGEVHLTNGVILAILQKDKDQIMQSQGCWR